MVPRSVGRRASSAPSGRGSPSAATLGRNRRAATHAKGAITGVRRDGHLNQNAAGGWAGTGAHANPNLDTGSGSAEAVYTTSCYILKERK